MGDVVEICSSRFSKNLQFVARHPFAGMYHETGYSASVGFTDIRWRKGMASHGFVAFCLKLLCSTPTRTKVQDANLVLCSLCRGKRSNIKNWSAGKPLKLIRLNMYPSSEAIH